MAMEITAKRAFAMGISTLVLLAPLQAGAAIYIKFDGVEGESKDSGEAHLDYLTITMNNAAADDHSAGDEHEIEYDVAGAASAGVEPDEIDARAAARSSSAMTRSGHQATHVVQQRGGRPQLATDSEHKDWIIIESMSSPVFRERGSGLATGKRQHKPLSVTKEIDKSSTQLAIRPAGTGAARDDGTLKLPTSRGPGNITLKRGMMPCGEGAQFPSMRLADDQGNMAKLTDVTVASCSAEEVSFNYTKIEW